MSIADHFEHAPDASFIRDYDRGTARRQFNVSLVLVVVIALAATALGWLIRFETPAQPGPSMADAAAAPPAYAGRL